MNGEDTLFLQTFREDNGVKFDCRYDESELNPAWDPRCRPYMLNSYNKRHNGESDLSMYNFDIYFYVTYIKQLYGNGDEFIGAISYDLDLSSTPDVLKLEMFDRNVERIVVFESTEMHVVFEESLDNLIHVADFLYGRDLQAGEPKSQA